VACSFRLSWELVFAAITAAATLPVWYWMVIHAAYQWAGTVRAIVNLGRLELARSLDLVLPRNRSAEVDMWNNVVWLVREGPAPNGDPLLRYRSARGPRQIRPSSSKGHGHSTKIFRARAGADNRRKVTKAAPLDRLDR